MRVPSYIVKHANGIYYFRYVIPKCDAGLFPNKREIRRSLSTRSRSEAIRAAKIYWYQIVVEKKLPSLEENITNYEAMLRNGKRISEELVLFEKSYQTNFDSTFQSEFITHLNEYDIECLNLFDEHQSKNKHKPEKLSDAPSTNTSSKLLSTAFEEYTNDGAEVEPATLRGYHRHFDLLLKITGLTYLSELNIDAIRKYKTTLPLLPPNLSQNKRLSGLSIKQVLEQQPFEKTLSPKSIKTSSTLVKSFLKWLFVQQYLKNDLSGLLDSLRNRTTKKDNEHRAIFTSEDLTKLFGINEYQTTGFRKYSFRYWLPLLGLYTGARINELCQLEVNDIIEQDGLYAISINSNNGKKVKTKSGIRLIPIHKKLIQLGFIDYLNRIKTLNNTKLFPPLKPDRDGDCSRKVSRFFNSSYKSSTNGLVGYAGITKSTSEGVKVFHSLRHTFINQWKQQQLDPMLVKQIVGHASSDITYDTYGKNYPLDTISKEMDKINFEIKLPVKWLRRFY